MSGDLWGGARRRLAHRPVEALDPFDPTACYAAWCIKGNWASGDLSMANGTLYGTFNNDLTAYNGATGAVRGTGPQTGAVLARPWLTAWSSTEERPSTHKPETSCGPAPSAVRRIWRSTDRTCFAVPGVDTDSSSILGSGRSRHSNSSASATFTYGNSQSFDVTTVVSPSPPQPTVVTSKGKLPKGLKFKDTGTGSAVISGTPSCSGSGCTASTTYTPEPSGDRGELFSTDDHDHGKSLRLSIESCIWHPGVA